ncbi:uncharacterized protein BO72DRAFT_492925 [Aspergillus fijiensis CBS 313.89]|uniref:Uncharacterized protein n=1 Tax=Aspergillus fijiensis CBS 313.89 TaxID=1448319 RepID=A0A8G1W583_9EURO|nr:uncharacterized protein BO72DRAFT_492925 [Aspergillus fijiensis CBS 313.89]RAK80944.1 hypothetical protein BO72DRAFT_492925 [Aspergillus fijiensis CBS 313.89]
MTAAQEARDVWYEEMVANATLPALAPMEATWNTSEYNDLTITAPYASPASGRKTTDAQYQDAWTH